jgi:hypothetical protein
MGCAKRKKLRIGHGLACYRGCWETKSGQGRGPSADLEQIAPPEIHGVRVRS